MDQIYSTAHLSPEIFNNSDCAPKVPSRQVPVCWALSAVLTFAYVQERVSSCRPFQVFFSHTNLLLQKGV